MLMPLLVLVLSWSSLGACQAGAAAPAGRKTLETVAAADALVDALDMAAHEEEKQQEHERSIAGG
jgi:hypothetical protein